MDDNKKYIDGIYNYCDRWCEKCGFTSNCRLYSTETKIIAHEILNDGELPKLEDIFQKEIEEMSEKLEELDLEEDDLFFDEEENLKTDNETAEESIDDESEKTDNELDPLSYEYFILAHAFCQEIDKKYKLSPPTPKKLEDPVVKYIWDNYEVISWFLSLIHVKIKRALWSKDRMEKEDDEDEKEFYRYDMDGTAKVAIIGIKRSIHSFNNLYGILPEYAEEISGFLVHLGKILNTAENEFPDYDKFVRPGFDTIQ